MSAGPSESASEAGLPRLRFFARKIQRHPWVIATKEPFIAVKSAVTSTLRMATQQFRHLPTVVIIGAQKAGTTQLHAHLTKHPRCLSGAEKEVSYFTRHSGRTLEWYRSRFPLRYRVERLRAHVIDASPSYMAVPQALRRMKAVLPDARVIVVLRDPTARAYSNYQHCKTRHKEDRTFAVAVANELRQNRFPPRFGVALRPDAERMTYYLARGYYALHLELLFELYSRDRVFVLDSLDLFTDTNAVCQQVFDFLQLQRCHVRPEKIYNRGYYREQIDPLLAERLREHYRPYDELLAQLMGRRFSWMTAASGTGVSTATAA